MNITSIFLNLAVKPFVHVANWLDLFTVNGLTQEIRAIDGYPAELRESMGPGIDGYNEEIGERLDSIEHRSRTYGVKSPFIGMP
jgi:hypothetical protein